MKKVLLISMFGFYSLSSGFGSLVGDYNSKKCSVKILELKKSSPVNYGIIFPEWKYQVVLYKKGKFDSEFIISDDSKIYDSGDKITLEKTLYGDFSSTDYELILYKNSTTLKKVVLYKENIIGLNSKQFSCSF